MAVYWRRGQQTHVIPLCAHCGSGGVSEVFVVMFVTMVIAVMVADTLSSVLCAVSLVLSERLLS